MSEKKRKVEPMYGPSKKVARFIPPAYRRSANYGRPLTMQGGPRLSHKEAKDITTLTTTVITNGATGANVFLLNGIQSGTTASTRIGRRITMKSILVKFNASLAPTTTGASSLRILIVYDKQANAATPAATAVLVTDTISSPMNLSNSSRFVTLIDETVSCIGASGPAACDFTRFRKLNLITEFNANNAGTIGDITTGSIHCYAYQDGNLQVAAVTSTMYVRIRFLDD